MTVNGNPYSSASLRYIVIPLYNISTFDPYRRTSSVAAADESPNCWPSTTFSFRNCLNMSGPPTLPPDIGISFVLLTGYGPYPIFDHCFTMVLTIVSAIFRYPVSLPPAIVMRPDSEWNVSSFRDISDGSFPV